MNIKNTLKRFMGKLGSDKKSNPRSFHYSASYTQKNGEKPVLTINGENVDPSEHNIQQAFLGCTAGFHDFADTLLDLDTPSLAGYYFPQIKEDINEEFGLEDMLLEEDEDLVRELNEVYANKSEDAKSEKKENLEENPERVYKQGESAPWDGIGEFIAGMADKVCTDNCDPVIVHQVPTTASRVAQHLSRRTDADARIAFWTVTDSKTGKTKNYTTTITIVED